MQALQTFLDPDQAWKNASPDLDPNCDHIPERIFCIDHFEKRKSAE